MIEVIKTDRFRFFELDGAVAMYAYQDELMGLSLNEDKIANHTQNTWEQGRSQQEIHKNTLQGKIAEEFFVDLVAYQNRTTAAGEHLTYLPYDAFRGDAFGKHAPLDGLLFCHDNPHVTEVIARINQDITQGRYGSLRQQTLQFCRDQGVRLVEIKSSKIPARVARTAVGSPLKTAYHQQLIDELKQLDLFKYPKFNRKDGGHIHDTPTYLDWVRAHVAGMADKSDADIIASEVAETLDVYTRIFVDGSLKSREGRALYVGYFLGYALGAEFYGNLRIMNFPSAKSKNAIYVTYPIGQCTDFRQLNSDTRLWGC